jgi:hypothetical protein
LKSLGHVDHCSLADHPRLIFLKRILLGMEKNAPYMSRLAGLKRTKSAGDGRRLCPSKAF